MAQQNRRTQSGHVARFVLTTLSLGLLATSCGNSSNSNPSTTTVVVATTLPRDGSKITLEWLQSGTDFLAFPSIEGLGRSTVISKLSSYQSGLVDFLEMTRSNSDPIISTIGAAWVSDRADAVSEMLASFNNNDKEGLAIALGKYEYLSSKKKTAILTKCLVDGENC